MVVGGANQADWDLSGAAQEAYLGLGYRTVLADDHMSCQPISMGLCLAKCMLLRHKRRAISAQTLLKSANRSQSAAWTHLLVLPPTASS